MIVPMRLRAAGVATVAALLVPFAGAGAADAPQRSSSPLPLSVPAQPPGSPNASPQVARISGVLRTPGGKPLQSGAVVLVPRDGSTLDSLPSDGIEITPDGRFVLRSVPPGSYHLRARASVDSRQVPLFG